MKPVSPLYDAAIIGAGPAGASTATLLAKQGLRVLLVDRAAFPRPKLCGEGLMPAGVGRLKHILASAGLAFPAHQTFEGLRIWPAGSSPEPINIDFPQRRTGLVVSRRLLDQALLESAIAAGAEFIPHFNVRSFELNPERTVGRLIGRREGRTTEVRTARMLIGADGIGSTLAEQAGISTRDSSRRWAVQFTAGEYRSPCERVEIFCGRRGEAYVAPFQDGARVTFLLESDFLHDSFGKPLIDRLLIHFSGLRSRISGAANLWGTPRISRRLERSAVPGLLLAGDAGGACDPINGQGMTLALHDAELIAKLTADGLLDQPARLADAYNRLRETYFNASYELADHLRTILRSPFLVRRFSRLVKRSPRFARRVAELAGGDSHPGNRLGFRDKFQLVLGF